MLNLIRDQIDLLELTFEYTTAMFGKNSCLDSG